MHSFECFTNFYVKTLKQILNQKHNWSLNPLFCLFMVPLYESEGKPFLALCLATFFRWKVGVVRDFTHLPLLKSVAFAV